MHCSCEDNKTGELEKTPSAVSKKLLASPEFQPGTKFSPLSPIQRLSPLMRSDKPARSILRQIAGAKSPVPAALAKKEPDRARLTVTISPEKKPPVISEEDKATPKSLTLAPSFNRAKRTPFIDSTKLSELMMSPLRSTEGVRYAPPSGPFQDAVQHYQGAKAGTKGGSTDSPPKPVEAEKREIILCSCGRECDESMTECATCAAKFRGQTHVGYLYEKSEKQMLTRKWYKLLGDQLYRILPVSIVRI